jgi:hypothetical protein
MKQYVIIARDGEDANALQRRMQIREKHLSGASLLKANGQFLIGGAMLDADNKMRGSVMIVQFETQEDFDHWYSTEPYIVNGVWKDIEVKPFRVAIVL